MQLFYQNILIKIRTTFKLICSNKNIAILLALLVVFSLILFAVFGEKIIVPLLILSALLLAYAPSLFSIEINNLRKRYRVAILLLLGVFGTLLTLQTDVAKKKLELEKNTSDKITVASNKVDPLIKEQNQIIQPEGDISRNTIQETEVLSNVKTIQNGELNSPQNTLNKDLLDNFANIDESDISIIDWYHVNNFDIWMENFIEGKNTNINKSSTYGVGDTLDLITTLYFYKTRGGKVNIVKYNDTVCDFTFDEEVISFNSKNLKSNYWAGTNRKNKTFKEYEKIDTSTIRVHLPKDMSDIYMAEIKGGELHLISNKLEKTTIHVTCYLENFPDNSINAVLPISISNSLSLARITHRIDDPKPILLLEMSTNMNCEQNSYKPYSISLRDVRSKNETRHMLKVKACQKTDTGIIYSVESEKFSLGGTYDVQVAFKNSQKELTFRNFLIAEEEQIDQSILNPYVNKSDNFLRWIPEVSYNYRLLFNKTECNKTEEPENLKHATKNSEERHPVTGVSDGLLLLTLCIYDGEVLEKNLFDTVFVDTKPPEATDTFHFLNIEENSYFSPSVKCDEPGEVILEISNKVFKKKVQSTFLRNVITIKSSLLGPGKNHFRLGCVDLAGNISFAKSTGIVNKIKSGTNIPSVRAETVSLVDTDQKVYGVTSDDIKIEWEHPIDFEKYVEFGAFLIYLLPADIQFSYSPELIFASGHRNSKSISWNPDPFTDSMGNPINASQQYLAYVGIRDYYQEIGKFEVSKPASFHFDDAALAVESANFVSGGLIELTFNQPVYSVTKDASKVLNASLVSIKLDERIEAIIDKNSVIFTTTDLLNTYAAKDELQIPTGLFKNHLGKLNQQEKVELYDVAPPVSARFLIRRDEKDRISFFLPEDISKGNLHVFDKKSQKTKKISIPRGESGANYFAGKHSIMTEHLFSGITPDFTSMQVSIVDLNENTVKIPVTYAE